MTSLSPFIAIRLGPIVYQVSGGFSTRRTIIIWVITATNGGLRAMDSQFIDAKDI